MTPDLTPDPTPDPTPDLTPDPTPDPTPDLTPDPTLDGLTPAGRDLQVARVLAVDPLDDLTRHRLVHAALAERVRTTPPVGRFAAALGVAAALVIGAVIGTLVVNRPESLAPTTAASAPDRAAEPKAPPSSAAGAADAGAPALVPATALPLGDLGVLASSDALAPALAARRAAGGDASQTSASADACLARGPGAAGLAAISEVATATLDTGPAVVVVGRTPAGANVAVVLDPTTCAVLESVALPD